MLQDVEGLVLFALFNCLKKGRLSVGKMADG
jgi:hypothetical protein